MNTSKPYLAKDECCAQREATLKEQLEEELKQLVRRADSVRQRIELVKRNPEIEKYFKLY